MELFWLILFMTAIFAPLVWNKIAIGKRIHDEEQKAGRDLTHEINPFTGGRD
ncbi:hypothetical protein [Paenibacillus wulumuqiensis]|uniref:hypothetical protein n=1 Tax=Paenibacillus wulumuqiensis TaxID=1567107 RepID=UPI000ACE3B3B|nr:hypothetical protein [Paenibacillus wulumuqiensis]